MRVDDVLQRQRMDVEQLGERLQCRFGPQANDIHPQHGPFAEKIAQLAWIVDFLFDHAVMVVGHYTDRGGIGTGLNRDRAWLRSDR